MTIDIRASKQAQQLFRDIGRGTPLRMPHDVSKTAALVDTPHWQLGYEEQPVSRAIAQELIEANVLHKLTEHQIGSRSGWREMGLDGTVADFWVHIR